MKAPPGPDGPPLPAELVASQKLQRAFDRVSRGLTPMQVHHLLALLTADVVHRSALLDAHLPLDDRQERAARDYLRWCRTVDRPPVRYVEVPADDADGDSAAAPA